MTRRLHDAATALPAMLLAAFPLALPAQEQAAQEQAAQEQAAQEQAAQETITIFGSPEERERITGSAQRVEADVLEAFQYDDINRVLNLVPGVYLRGEDGYGLRPNIGMRGASSDRSQKVTLLEDGVPLAPAPYSAPAAYFFPLTTRMTGVEVYKGPSSIQHGPQTIGGTINLISAPVPREPTAMVDLAAGSDGYGRVHARAGDSWARFGLSGELVHLTNDGFKELDGGGATGFEKNELILKSNVSFSPGTLGLRLSYADEASDETYLGLTESDFRADPGRRYRASALDRMDWDQLAGRADWSGMLLGGEVEVTAYGQSFDRAWRKFNNFRGADVRDVLANPETPLNDVLYRTLTGARSGDPNTDADDLMIGTNAREFDLVGIQARGFRDFTTGAERRTTHALELGLRLHNDRIRRLHDEYAFDMIGGELVGTEDPRAITADNTATTAAASIWVRDEVSFGPWSIVPGLRVEDIAATFVDRLAGITREADYTEVLPGVGLSFALSDRVLLLGGVHKGFSPATPGRGPGVDPEEAVNWEGGARWSGGFGRFEGVLFYSDYGNLTAECTFSAGCAGANLGEQTNAGEVEVAGLEALWNHGVTLGAGLELTSAVSYTYTKTEILEAFTSVNPQFGSVEPGYELPYVPEHRANASIGLAGARWGASLSLTWQSEMRDTAGAGPPAAGEGADAFTVADLAAHYDVGPSLRLTGRIDNLLDEEYVAARRPFGARPGLPLSLQLGLTWRY